MLTIGPRDNQVNKEVPALLEEVQQAMQHGFSDSYILYFAGMLQRHLNRLDEASAYLVQALKTDIYNYAAWQELVLCMTSPAIVCCPSMQPF